MNDTATPADSRPTRPRFSLLNLIALMTIAALAFGLYSSARRNAKLDERNQEIAAENKEFRNELGIFEVEDPKMIHAIRVPTKDSEPCKYRVYLPPGRKYMICYKSNGIPEHEIPAAPSSHDRLEPGHYLFSVQIDRGTDSKTGEPKPYVTVLLKSERTDDVNSKSSSHISIGERMNDWIINKQTGNTSYSWQGPGTEVELHDPKEPCVFYRARANDVATVHKDAAGKVIGWSTTSVKGECDGFMAWIEAEPTDE